MSASRQGMGFEEMEQVVAQRVANAIEAITIYESKIRMAHDSMNQRNELVTAHATGAGNKKAYAGNFPYYNKCKWHHIGPCTVKCGNYKRVGHTTNNYRTFAPTTIKRALVANQKPAVTYFGCGAQRHFKSKCPRLKNQMYDNHKKKEGNIRKNSKVRIYQKLHENRQKRANTDTRNGRAQEKPKIQSQSQKKIKHADVRTGTKCCHHQAIDNPKRS
ncbi:hypothetical protein Tco_1148631 [Tanacetum coccineum]